MKPKGKQHAASGPMKPERGRKNSRVVYLCIAALYLLVVVGATVYSLTAYQDKLPQVELVLSEKGRVPKECLLSSPGGTVINTVERQEGPWGRRYRIKQLSAFSCRELPDGDMFVYESLSNENPIAFSSTGEPLHDGMEVRLSSEQDRNFDDVVSAQKAANQEARTMLEAAGDSQAQTSKQLSGELRIAMPIRDESLYRWSKKFREIHPDVKITFDCIVPDTYADIPDDYTTRYIEKTVTELSSGDAADIADLGFVSFYEYGKAGLFEDINEMIANDPDINRDDLYTNILDALESPDGSLYVLPTYFRFNVFVLNDYIIYKLGIDVEEEYRDGADYNDLMDLFWQAVDAGVIEPGGENGCYFARNQNKNFFEGYVTPQYLDEKAREARFDTPEFIEYLEKTDALPFEHTVAQGGEFPYNWPNFGISDYFCQQVPTTPTTLGSIDQNSLSGSTGAIFYQGREGNIPFSAASLLALPKGGNKELAWEFLKFVIEEKEFPEEIDIYNPPQLVEYFIPYSQAVPINRKNYLKLYSAAFSPALAEKFDKYQQTLNMRCGNSVDLMENLMDILISYYDNHLISAEECAKQLQERAWIYLNE